MYLCWKKPLLISKHMKCKIPRLEIFLTDCHFPGEDPQVWALELAVAKYFQPDLVWLNGDIIDFGSISRFRTSPRSKLDIAGHLDHARTRLQGLRKQVPDAEMVFLEGNHDLRLQTYLWDKAPELSELPNLELPSLLELKTLGCSFFRNGTKCRVGELYHLHGNEVATGYTYPARNMLAKINCNVIFGHVHRFSVAHQRDLRGSTRVAWSIGCTQRLTVDYDFHTGSWTNGFALVEYIPSGLFHITPVEVFRDGKALQCIVYGKRFSV